MLVAESCGIGRLRPYVSSSTAGDSLMKIASIFAHRVELPSVEATYKWSGRKSVSVFDRSVKKQN